MQPEAKGTAAARPDAPEPRRRGADARQHPDERRSRDGGETWESRRLPYEGSMFGVLSWQDDHILVYGLRGNVLALVDLNFLHEHAQNLGIPGMMEPKCCTLLADRIEGVKPLAVVAWEELAIPKHVFGK